jgi:hypothetical protein
LSPDIAVDKLLEYRRHPTVFCREQFGCEPDGWQHKAFEAFASQDPKTRRIAMKACVGPGKTFVEAVCIWNFLSCYGDPVDHPRGAGVSITLENLKANLWPELANLRNRSKFLQAAFDWTSTRVYSREYPATWFFEARSWPKTANPEEQGKTLSGLHAKYVLAVIDESGAIPPQVGRAAEQTLATGPIFGKILQGGNPLDPNGMLYAATVRHASLWHIINITGDPDDPERSPRIDVAWAKEQIAAYGRDNPWVMAHILGKFPPSAVNQIIGPEELEVAMMRAPRPDEYEWAQKRLGVDAARFGDDPWVIFPRQGIACFNPIIHRNPKTEEIVGAIMRKKIDWGSELELVDNTGGFGGGCIDGLRVAKCKGVIEVNYSGKPTDQRFFNKRSEIIWTALNQVRSAWAIPRLPEFIQEATAFTYWYEKGKLRVVEKDQIKKILGGKSSNLVDALANTCAIPDAPAAMGGMSGVFVSAQQQKPQRWHPHDDQNDQSDGVERRVPL